MPLSGKRASEAPPPSENPQNQSPRLRVRLYVAGESANSVAALANLHAALGRRRAEDVDLEIIDTLVDPERCVRDGVLVMPMLVRVEPGPEQRLLGSLWDRRVLHRLLGIEPTSQ